MWWEGFALWAALAMVAYGVINAIAHIIILARSLRRSPPGVAYLVLVQDQADRIEGVVRTLARKGGSELVLVDLGSADESGAILDRLAADYSHARCLHLGPVERSTALSVALRSMAAPFVVLVDAKEIPAKKG